VKLPLQILLLIQLGIIMPTIHLENAKSPELFVNLVNDVINGQEFLITQAGKPVAKLLPATRPNRFPDLSDFRASIAPSHLSAGEMVSQMRDEEDEKFG